MSGKDSLNIYIIDLTTHPCCLVSEGCGNKNPLVIYPELGG